jgi:5-methylthioadenosine/S-adenosylhomocysteine deaminase
MARGMDIVYGELWVFDEKIAYVGEGMPPRMPFDREIDLNGNLVLPGFKNAHAHSAMTFLRSFADDLPLLDWLDQKIFPMEARLVPEHAYMLSLLAIMEYLTSGITAAFDMYMFPREMARATIDSGFRTVLCGTVNNNSYKNSEELVEWYQYYNTMHERLSCRLGFHAEYTCARDVLEGVAQAVRCLKAPVFCHNSESRREVEQCVARTGMTPTTYMDRFGLFEYGGGGYHCVCLDDRDTDIFSKRGLAVISCPGSNSKLASGIAPIKTFVDAGIPVAIGTDGPASNNALDMFREMFLLTALQKLDTGDASALPAGDVLKMACVTGARVMGLTECDSLAAGKYADLIVIDLMQPNMQPLNNIMDNLVYSGGKSVVKMTMVNGRILYEDGRFDIGVDPTAVYAAANRVIRDMNI